MLIAAWIACTTALMSGAVYFQCCCAQIECELTGEPVITAFMGTTWWRGTTPESRQFRRLLVVCMVTGLLALVHAFMLARQLP